MLKFIKFIIYSTVIHYIILLCTLNSLLANDKFYKRDHIVVDLVLGVEWLRCSVGQQWSGKECMGKAIKIPMKQIESVVVQANEQLGGNWRLPTRKELENLVCMECRASKIDKNIFPNTPAEPFWTGQKNEWNENYYWTVNFFSGHTFGRFPGSIPNFVRLVRDR